jgi:hypothetical protein
MIHSTLGRTLGSPLLGRDDIDIQRISCFDCSAREGCTSRDVTMSVRAMVLFGAGVVS